MSGKNRKTGNLVALGSAAVVAVYGAGFMRTAEAAERFAAQSDERRNGADELAPGVTVATGAATPANTDSGTGSPNGVAHSDIRTNANAASAAPVAAIRSDDGGRKIDATTATAPQSSTAPRSTNAVVPMPPEVTTVMSASAVTATASMPDPKAAPRTETKPAAEKTVASAPVASPAVAATVPPAATPAVVANPANPATSAKAIADAQAAGPIPTVNASAASGTSTTGTVLKTGEYTGYGTSRHGDVEVYVETTDGKITYVKISQCLTQYSCSWIEDLPKQVLARQSTKIDAVSGATQSANAFYYALVAALNKAK